MTQATTVIADVIGSSAFQGVAAAAQPQPGNQCGVRACIGIALRKARAHWIGTMRRLLLPLLAAAASAMAGCGGGTGDSHTDPVPGSTTVLSAAAWRGTLQVEHGGVSVDVVVDRPQGTEFDVLLVHHGTVMQDSLIMQAANDTLDSFRPLVDDRSILVASVAYPEENLLLGDNLPYAEAALLCVRGQAAEQLGIRIRHMFLGGHSQGVYPVTRLNTLHPTRGVISNAPGPLDLVFRCQLEERGALATGEHCTRLRNAYGTTAANPSAYWARSLRNFTTGHRSDILFVQGLEDSPIQMHAWPAFAREVAACGDCRGVEFLEIPGLGHASMFVSPHARDVLGAFLQARR